MTASTRTSAVTLRRLATAYLPLLGLGVWLSLRDGVGAHPGGDPVRDLPLRGTGLAPPLFLPAALFAGALLSARRGPAGVAGTVVVGVVGLAFTAGSTVNLANDVAAARDAGSPVALTIAVAAVHWVFGPALAVSALRRLRHRPGETPRRRMAPPGRDPDATLVWDGAPRRTGRGGRP